MKNRQASYGITIFGILSIFFSLFILSFIVIPEFRDTPNMFTAAYLVTGVCWLVFGIGVLKRLSWARMGLIFVATIYVVDSVEYPSHIISAIKNREIGALASLVIGLIFFGSLIFYFTRPKIKQQFINNANKEMARTGNG